MKKSILSLVELSQPSKADPCLGNQLKPSKIRLAEPSLPGSLPRRANCGKSGVSRCHDQPRRSPALQRPSAHAN